MAGFLFESLYNMGRGWGTHLVEEVLFMNHKILWLSLATLVVVAGGIFGFFAYQNHKLEKAREKVTREVEREMDQKIGRGNFHKVEQANKQNSDTMMFIPVLKDKSDNQALKQKILDAAKKEQNDSNNLVFFTFDRQRTGHGVEGYRLKKIRYDRAGFGYKRTSERQFDQQLVDADTGKVLTLGEVLSPDPDALLKLKLAMQKAIIAQKKLSLEQMAELGEAKYPERLSETSINLTDKALTLPISIPNDPELKHVAVPLSYLAGHVKSKYLAPGTEGEKPLRSANSGKKIALTFDDGPSRKVTPRVLALLNKYHAKATFFVLGSEVVENPGLVKQELMAGHEIGNHSWSHPQLTKLSNAEVSEQVLKTQMAVYEQTGYFPELMRPPYGAVHHDTALAIGLPLAQWTVDTEDWKYKSGRLVTNKVLKSARDGGIILMHDIHETTADGLEETLKQLKKQGYEFVTVSELLNQKLEIGHEYFDATQEKAV